MEEGIKKESKNVSASSFYFSQNKETSKQTYQQTNTQWLE
jgi:hypothetical protein